MSTESLSAENTGKLDEEPARKPDAEAARIAALSDADLEKEATATGVTQVKTTTVDINPYSVAAYLTVGDAGTPKSIGGPGNIFIRGESNAGRFNDLPLTDLVTADEAAVVKSVLARVSALCAKSSF